MTNDPIAHPSSGSDSNERISMDVLRDLGFTQGDLMNYELPLSANLMLSVGNFPFNAFLFTLQVISDDEEYICAIECPPLNTKKALLDFIGTWKHKFVDIE